ncbi:hypothetical protein ACGFLT_04690 [Micromonospora chalcea]|uniref:hypothetical protein n=1 Tax=Micromonospora sp. B006 TaxID=2201999 RepID=UPI000E300F90|nr:hypothetical protein [Micromonospora sp. B006]
MADRTERIFYLRSRRARSTSFVLALIGLLAAVWGALEMSVPTATATGSVAMPVWVVLPIPAAAAIAAGIWSEMDMLEAGASRQLWRFDLTALVAGMLVAAVFLGLGLVVGGVGRAVPDALRNLVFWTGVALVSAALFGRRLAWALPLAAFFPYDWFGFSYHTNEPKAWATPMLHLSVETALISVGVFAAGAALATSPSARRFNFGRHLVMFRR